MAYSNSVIKSNHFVVELLPNVKEAFLNAAKSFGTNQKISRSLTESNIAGIESFNISIIYENIVLRNNLPSEYICDLNEEYELNVGGKYSNYMVNLPFTVTNKKQQWSLCCKINFTLHLSQLQEKGLHIVANIPLFGIEVVINYNCIAKDILISFRLPLIDGNNVDRNNASSNGCNLICLNVEFSKNKIDQRTFEGASFQAMTPNKIDQTALLSFDPMTPIFLPQPLPPNQPSYFPPPLIPPKPKPSNSSPNGPPPVIRPRNDSLFPKTTTTTSNYNAQNHPQQQYSNTSITPPIIPLRPYPGTTSTNTNGTQSYYSRSYSSQASYQFGFGRQSGFGSTSTNSSSSTQSNTATNQWNTLPPKSVTTYSQSQQYITSNSAPTTPTIPPNTPNSNPPTTKTEPVRKGVGQFNVSVNKAMDGIDRIITKASNALSSPRNKNTTPNQNQPQQNTAAVKTN